MIIFDKEKLPLIKSALVAIGVFITSTIVVYAHMDFGFLSIVTAYVLLQLFFSELSKKAIERIFGPAISAILILIVLTVFRNHYFLMLLSAVILLMIFVYCFAVGYFPYSMILGAITISLISAMDVNKDLFQAMHLGLYWVINLLIGSMVILIIDFFCSKWMVKNKEPIEIKRVEQQNNGREKFKFNYKAAIVAARVAATFIILLLLNRRMQWSFIDIQAVIAGIIISAQPSIKLSHQRALMRLLGVVIGALIAIGFAYFLQIIPYPFLIIILITFSLGLLTLLSETYPFFEYAFLQAGVMIPLILITSNQQAINVHLAIERSLGSLEGGLVAIAMVYVSALILMERR